MRTPTPNHANTRGVPPQLPLIGQINVSMPCHVAFHDVRASLVRAGRHGSLKLGLCPRTEALPDILRGNRVEFGRHDYFKSMAAI